MQADTNGIRDSQIHMGRAVLVVVGMTTGAIAVVGTTIGTVAIDAMMIGIGMVVGMAIRMVLEEDQQCGGAESRRGFQSGLIVPVKRFTDFVSHSGTSLGD